MVDAVTGAQTAAGQEALMEFLDFTNTHDIILTERYLLAVAFSTHPTHKLLHDLFVSISYIHHQNFFKYTTMYANLKQYNTPNLSLCMTFWQALHT